ATLPPAGERSAAPERAGLGPSGAGSGASRVVIPAGERSAAPERAGLSPSGAGSGASRVVIPAGERSAAPERAGLSPSGAGSGASPGRHPSSGAGSGASPGSHSFIHDNARLLFGAALAVHALMVVVALATALVFSLIVRPS